MFAWAQVVVLEVEDGIRDLGRWLCEFRFWLQLTLFAEWYTRVLLSFANSGNAAYKSGHKPTIRDIYTCDDGIRQVHLRAGDFSSEQCSDYRHVDAQSASEAAYYCRFCTHESNQ